MLTRIVLFVKIISLASVAIIIMATIYMNRDVFMSVEQMLSTRYVYDPDYYGEIRGDSCGSCDDGVIRFKDSMTLIDLMSDEESYVKEDASWTFRYLQKHLLMQFSKHNSDDTSDYAIKVIKYLLSKNPDKTTVSYVYYKLFMDADETFNKWDVKKDKLIEARSLFKSFCTDYWGKNLRIEKKSDGKYAVAAENGNNLLTTQSNWQLNKHTISRGNTFNEFNMIPLSCFENTEQVYDLISYEDSTKAAVLRGQVKVLSDLIDRKPEIINHIRENQSNYLIGEHQFIFSFQKEAVDWLKKALNQEKYNKSLNQIGAKNAPPG
jgi:hypothetical protein